MKVRTNADTPEDCAVAVKFGAEGVGLCRTEHMFFEKNRILAVREMIFAHNVADREKALAKILPFQREDFIGIFTVLNGHPVNIRLLDPPLHEFLPHTEEEKKELADSLHLGMDVIEDRGDRLHEFNPMLGHRGCRLGITFPEIYRVQIRAIIEAALICADKGIKVLPEIMIPLVAISGELTVLKEDAIKEIDKIFKEQNKTIKYKIGTMIELPRAAIVAGTLAKNAEFFSFGTNDLTQTTFGLSRDDAGKFLPDYVTKGLLPVDPFVSIDQNGVGFLMKHAVTEGRKTNPNMHFGICGEHGGETRSIEFCHSIGLDYVSCSPYRVPIARLAAAQAAIKNLK
jgi:pyruvate,orthophosphate dikinase